MINKGRMFMKTNDIVRKINDKRKQIEKNNNELINLEKNLLKQKQMDTELIS